MGNIDLATTQALVDEVEALRRPSLCAFTPLLPRIRSVPAGTTFLREDVMNPQSVNCACCVLWQLPFAERARLRLFAHCLRDYVFHELRTVKQMGYVVWSFFSGMEGSCNFMVILQSKSVGVSHETDV